MDAKQTRQGVLFALAAYFIWGIAPAYFKLIDFVPADEILTHRVIWSFFFMVALISVSRQWGGLKRLFKNAKESVRPGVKRGPDWWQLAAFYLGGK
ncbi:RarD protein [Atlantibacter hermannii]|nr:RarD protein [Atlantibacter hermannii]